MMNTAAMVVWHMEMQLEIASPSLYYAGSSPAADSVALRLGSPSLP